MIKVLVEGKVLVPSTVAQEKYYVGSLGHTSIGGLGPIKLGGGYSPPGGMKSLERFQVVLL